MAQIDDQGPKNLMVAGHQVFGQWWVKFNLATRSAEFLLDALRPSGELKRNWRQGKITNEVFLKDYAALILGLIELYQTDFQDKWFVFAQDLAEEMITLFEDPRGVCV